MLHNIVNNIANNLKQYKWYKVLLEWMKGEEQISVKTHKFWSGKQVHSIIEC